MPFRKFDLAPEHVEPLRAAFTKVCEALDLSCEPEDPATDLVAMKIIEVAAQAQFDPDRICALVVAQLKTSQPRGS